MQFSSIFFLSLSLSLVGAFEWPEKNQQCEDDAGPPFLDDEPGKKYHDGQQVSPVLLSDGKCAKPIKDACKNSKHGDAKTAYLEGPIACENQGWYCRIVNQDGWPAKGLTGDKNFGHCNSTDGYEDGYDQDGHCHGSATDNTYYWWIRDHFHRQYNGRLRCCCGWEASDAGDSGNNLITAGRVGNRCDYRREVTGIGDDTTDNCRDANEEHGLNFEGGCDQVYKDDQIGKPVDLPEYDDTCWEIDFFGLSEGNDEEDDEENDSADDSEDDEEDDEENDSEDDEEDDEENDSEDDEEDDSEDDEEDDEDDDGEICYDLPNKNKCKKNDACAFGKNKIKQCIPKKDKGCSDYTKENKCIKGGDCKWMDETCASKCDGIEDKNECKDEKKTGKNKKICKYKNVTNPCKKCQPKSCGEE